MDARAACSSSAQPGASCGSGAGTSISGESGSGRATAAPQRWARAQRSSTRGITVTPVEVQSELEDNLRGLGIGKALLLRVAAIAHEQKCGRLQWDVLEWNKPAIGFYEKLGAQMLTEWRIMRVDGAKLAALAEAAK